MKRLFLVLSFFLIIAAAVISLDSMYTSRVNKDYDDRIGRVLAPEKNQGLILQKKAIDSEDNILIYGSSELSSLTDKPFNPINFFQGKSDGFQVNLIGRGYCQSIIHAMNIGALGNKLQNNKVVFIISPQWFSKEGLTKADFEKNFSELHFYAFMFNKELDHSLKLALAERVSTLISTSESLIPVYKYCELYKQDTLLSRGTLCILMPYYKSKFYLLSIKDKINAGRLLSSTGHNRKVNNSTPKRDAFDWEEERIKAVSFAQTETDNNSYYIQNDYYDTYIRNKIESCKGSSKNASYLESPEYDDLMLFMDICKNMQIDPLIISIPVHGKWYDYCEFDINERQNYYEKINKTVQSYNFKIADFSSHEYEPYFLKDIMHIGWKGWIYFNEAIDEYYRANDQ
ncbi:MAG: D-alanyl-lipoteichoic acid biosynthesis protein DltD [Syntrophaceticus schinkii]|jgi:D-alanine transfer protein